MQQMEEKECRAVRGTGPPLASVSLHGASCALISVKLIISGVFLFPSGLSAHTHVELPFYSKFLLIAAYLASYNPARTDKRFFLKVGGCFVLVVYTVSGLRLCYD